MIYIKQGELNQFVLTLQEKSTIAATGGTPFFLFKFDCDIDNGYSTKTFLPYYISSNTRYDYIKLYEDDALFENLTGGTVNLSKAGWWSYTIYEQSNQYNLITSATTSIVESGKVLVTGTTTTFIF